jgi:hypothetical protein
VAAAAVVIVEIGEATAGEEAGEAGGEDAATVGSDERAET